MKFNITPGLSITLSSNRIELYAIDIHNQQNNEIDINLKAFSLVTGVTMRIENVEGTDNSLIIDTGLIPTAPPKSAYRYDIQLVENSICNISFKYLAGQDGRSTIELAGIRLTNPYLNGDEASTNLPEGQLMVSNTQTNILSINLSTVNYVQLTSDGSVLKIITVY